jgi:ATP-dependent DNA ligase
VRLSKRQSKRIATSAILSANGEPQRSEVATVGIVLSEHTDEDGALLFIHACRMGLEGIVSKKLSASYRSGRSTEWLKIKNPDSPAMVRHREDRW